MKGKNLLTAGIGIGVGWIILDRFLHILPDWLAVVLFLMAWVLIIAGVWMERVTKL